MILVNNVKKVLEFLMCTKVFDCGNNFDKQCSSGRKFKAGKTDFRFESKESLVNEFKRRKIIPKLCCFQFTKLYDGDMNTQRFLNSI